MGKFIPLLIVLLSVCIKAIATPTDNGVILVYHHVSTETPASTSISPEQFRQHMAYLAEHHKVISLAQLVQALRNKSPLPDKAVAITFDDGYMDIYEHGHEVLKEYGFLYTIFINPPVIGSRKDQLTWPVIQKMQTEGVTFANHTSTHDYLLKRLPGETQAQWLQRIEKDVLDAEVLIEKYTGTSIKYLAYPYGEYNQTLSRHMEQLGFTSFAQHSGPVASFSDFSALPRFAAAGIYANLNSLKTKLNSLAMPVTAKKIEDPHVTSQNLAPQQELTLATNDLRMSQINCFLNGARLEVSYEENRLTLPLKQELAKGRSRINCTAPSIKHKGRFYWYSQPWFVR